MATRLACRVGDTVLVRGEVIRIGDEGPLVRFVPAWSPRSAVYCTPVAEDIVQVIAADVVPADQVEESDPTDGRV